ncbi:MAG: nuclear transport factor 2 family protein [Silicimonas sp.]|nr:nuclear transport factor 2 family protein [Silicimonas sp.]
MNTQEIAQKLCAHCQNHTEAQGLQELYADDAVSIEPMAPEGMNPVSEGRDAIQAKHDWWGENFEVHDFELEGPFINGDKFSVIFEMDATDKNSGQRWKAKEVALYEVENGKIARESFFMMPMG